MARTKGSKNKPGHRAGGARRGEKYEAEQREKQLQVERREAVIANQPPNPEPRTPSMTIAQSQEAYSRHLEELVPELRAKFNHESNPWFPVNGIVDVAASVEDTDDDAADDAADDDAAEAEKQSRHRTTYLPPPGTPVSTYLCNLLERFRNRNNDRSEAKFFENTHWVPPPMCKLVGAFGNEGPRPQGWYLAKTWVYMWLPLEQYPDYFRDPKGSGQKKHPCPWCGQHQTQSKGLHWRSVVWWTRTVFVLHRRFKCTNTDCDGGTGDEAQKAKEKTFASIDPNALSAIPTEVAERFEFMTRPKGPGIHEEMMYSFAFLSQKAVLFSAFCDLVNTLRTLDYSRQQLSYYRALKKWKPAFTYSNSGSPEVYSAFGEAGMHNGFTLTVRSMKINFTTFMQVKEPYMQASFERNQTDAIVVDRTFKAAGKVRLRANKENLVKPFANSLSIGDGTDYQYVYRKEN